MVIEYLRAQLELGGNEVYFEEPWIPRQSAQPSIKAKLPAQPHPSVSAPSQAPLPPPQPKPRFMHLCNR
jgi:hypothetical protein